MAHYTLIAPMSPLPLTDGMILKLEALSVDTDAAVTGVSATNWAVYGYDVSRPATKPRTEARPILIRRGGR